MQSILTRRQILNRAGFGMGSVALGALLADLGMTPSAHGQSLASNPLAPKPAHFPTKAKRVIHLFQNGGPSQIDTFDPKPALKKWDGKKLDTSNLSRLSQARTKGVGHASPFEFKQYGESGLPVSELFPSVAKHIDDICFIKSMHSEIPNHEPGLLMMNTGSVAIPQALRGLMASLRPWLGK